MRASIGLLMIVFTTASVAQETVHEQSTGALRLSPEVLTLLREEMRGVAGGMQSIALALSVGDWKQIEQMSSKVSASYIMQQKLSAAQRKELQGLPAEFKRLDAEFHARADKLRAAAQAHDAESAVFNYGRMLENCIACHGQYAAKRFPGLSAADKPAHAH